MTTDKQNKFTYISPVSTELLERSKKLHLECITLRKQSEELKKQHKKTMINLENFKKKIEEFNNFMEKTKQHGDKQ
jgi:hypothetical protein